MRELEFRFWDIDNKEMIYYDSASSIPQCMTWNGIIYKNGKVMNWIPLQFTGFYDTTEWEELTTEEQQRFLLSGNKPEYWTGRKIYEGDIIQFYTDELNGWKVFDVGWIHNGFYFLPFGNTWELSHSHKYKILGNKYRDIDIYKRMNSIMGELNDSIRNLR